MIQLRPYQVDLVDRTRALMRNGTRRIVIQAPTGSGKTILTAFMLKEASKRGLRSIFTVHRRELLLQSIRAFDRVGIGVGVISAGFDADPRFPIQVASIQSLGRRLTRVRTPDLIIYDECHHQAAATWGRVAHEYLKAFQIGLTATPARLDGKGLSQWFDALVCGPSVQELIDQGYLSPYRLYAPQGIIQVTGIDKQAGDYHRGQLTTAADKPTITGQALDHYRRLASGRRALVRCVSIEHSRHVAQQFLTAGILAKHVDGDTPTDERDTAFKDFADGRLTVITQVDLVNEGLDIAGIECAIDLRPTMSLTLWLQFCGRALRYVEGKTAIILDAAGNCARHGLPDEDRHWTLDGANKKRADAEAGPAIRVCPACFAAQRPGTQTCRFCGHTFVAEPRQVAQKDGQLEEVDVLALRRARKIEQGKAETYEDLVALGKARGYKNASGWAWFILQSRQGKRKQNVLA